MRAVFDELTIEAVGSEVEVLGESAHHLQVVRAKVGEEVLVLNGRGQRFLSKIINITKKEIVIKIMGIDEAGPGHQISLAIALPKKDAFEDILKLSVELGIQRIYPLTSEFSQYEYRPNDRVKKLLESALIQSNNLYLPKIAEQAGLDDYLGRLNSPLIYFSANPGAARGDVGFEKMVTILIGPEAGFSMAEEQKIMGNSHTKCIHLPTPILRAPTAVATSMGYLLHHLS